LTMLPTNEGLFIWINKSKKKAKPPTSLCTINYSSTHCAPLVRHTNSLFGFLVSDVDVKMYSDFQTPK